MLSFVPNHSNTALTLPCDWTYTQHRKKALQIPKSFLRANTNCQHGWSFSNEWEEDWSARSNVQYPLAARIELYWRQYQRLRRPAIHSPPLTAPTLQDPCPRRIPKINWQEVQRCSQMEASDTNGRTRREYHTQRLQSQRVQGLRYCLQWTWFGCSWGSRYVCSTTHDKAILTTYQRWSSWNQKSQYFRMQRTTVVTLLHHSSSQPSIFHISKSFPTSRSTTTWKRAS